MIVYYLPAVVAPNRRRITVAIWDAELEPTTLALGTLSVHVDDVAANVPDLAALRASLAAVQPGQLPPRWYYLPGSGQFERPDGSLWTPAADADRAALFEPLPTAGNPSLLAGLQAVLDAPAATTREKLLAHVCRRLVRALRRQLRGAAED